MWAICRSAECLRLEVGVSADARERSVKLYIVKEWALFIDRMRNYQSSDVVF